MASDKSAFTIWSEYLTARLAVGALTVFDVEVNLRSARAAARLWYRLDKRHRQRCVAHLRIAFDHLSDGQIERLAVRSFEHFAQLIIELAHSPQLITRDRWSRLVQLNQVGEAIDLFNSGRPLILITGHLGNWEALGAMLAMLEVPIAAIARPLDNPRLSEWVYGLRQKRGLRVISKWGATGEMLSVLGGRELLAFIADQNAGDKGLFVPFFGRLASTYKSIGLLAMERSTPIVCGCAYRSEQRFGFELYVHDVIHPEQWQSQHDPLYYITARYMRAIEQMILRRPHQYLWLHRRWKSRPRFERLGRPMPAAMRRNLEALPWMDQPTMHKLLAKPDPTDS